jgi:hypothetical protein
MNHHQYIPSTKCKKCQIKIEKGDLMHHARNCHGFGELQCFHCRFGVDDIKLLTEHYEVNHEGKPRFYYKRKSTTTKVFLKITLLLTY